MVYRFGPYRTIFPCTRSVHVHRHQCTANAKLRQRHRPGSFAPQVFVLPCFLCSSKFTAWNEPCHIFQAYHAELSRARKGPCTVRKGDRSCLAKKMTRFSKRRAAPATMKTRVFIVVRGSPCTRPFQYERKGRRQQGYDCRSCRSPPPADHLLLIKARQTSCQVPGDAPENQLRGPALLSGRAGEAPGYCGRLRGYCPP